MEDTLREGLKHLTLEGRCLNPCFNGRYSQRWVKKDDTATLERLNPCFNGRYSQRRVMVM